MKPIVLLKVGATHPEMATRLGDFEDWFLRRMDLSAGPIATVSPVAGDSLPGVDTLRAVIVTGSHAMVTDGAPWSERSAAWIRKIVDAGIPVLGVCYGHQLLAHALGGVVGDNPRGKEIGTVDIRLSPQGRQDPLFAGLPATFAAHACHTQSVLTLPPGSILLASSTMDPHHAFAVGRHAWGVQFHPEFSPSILKAYIQRHSGDLTTQGSDVRRLLTEVRATPHSGALLRRFQRLCS